MTAKQVQQILDESISWKPEELERMPKLFLLIRENYLRDIRSEMEKERTHFPLANHPANITCITCIVEALQGL